jgi:magnesium chelatase family protein
LPKEGSHFDLPIALAMMVAMGAISPDAIEGYAAIGELALDASIRPVPGALPAAIGANAMGKGLICPGASGPEAAWAGEDVAVLAAPHLLSLVNHFKGLQTLARPKPNIEEDPAPLPDLKDVKGQESAKRVLEIAAAGGHNLLMVGAPGSGKSMLAARLPSILPPLSPEEMLEVSMVHSLAGELLGGKLATRRPFRAPHHSASMAALVGGGSKPRPGEVSLAHLGVLFLDELPEFLPNVLDALRQPLESGETVIARANHRIAYPSRIQLVAAMNPCKCGGAAPGQSCRRGPRCAADYQARISGPLLDRIDLQIEVPAVSAADLVLPAPTEGSAEVRARVTGARERQQTRFAALGVRSVRTNSACSGALLEQVAMPDEAGVALLRQASEALQLSARGFHRTLRVARTLADLDDTEHVSRAHVAEALSYRGEALRRQRAA